MHRLLAALTIFVVLQAGAAADCPQCVANHKAKMAASKGFRGHVGGNLGGARFEGVGWGTSPQLALRSCCYSGRRPIVAQAVYKGRDGYYYACRLVPLGSGSLQISAIRCRLTHVSPRLAPTTRLRSAASGLSRRRAATPNLASDPVRVWHAVCICRIMSGPLTQAT